MAKSSATLAELAAGIVSGGIRVVDLTVPLEPATPTIQLPPIFAPSKPFALEEISKYDERGPAWYWNNIACGEHTGTHFDAPIHWVTGKDYPNNATHNIPVQKFIGPACVIDVIGCVRRRTVDFLVTVDVVKEWEGAVRARFPSGAWVLIRTDWSKRTGAGPFLNIKRRRSAHAGLSSAVRAVPGEGARYSRRGCRDGRHRRGAGGDVRSDVPVSYDHARLEPLRAREPDEPGSAAANGCGGDRAAVEDRQWFGQPAARARAGAWLSFTQRRSDDEKIPESLCRQDVVIGRVETAARAHRCRHRRRDHRRATEALGLGCAQQGRHARVFAGKSIGAYMPGSSA